MPHRDEKADSPRHRAARLIAVVAGIAAVTLSGLVPLLPVRQGTAAIHWPQGVDAEGHVLDVTAPLVSGAPRSLDVTIPCAAIATLPAAGGLVFSTIPPGGVDATKNGLFALADEDSVIVAYRDTVATSVSRAAIDAGECSQLHLWADPEGKAGPGAEFIGMPNTAAALSPEKKPQVAGVFTEMKVPADGLAARIDVDTRFIVSPTPIKWAALGLGVLSVAVAIGAAAALDRRGGHRVWPLRSRRRRAGRWVLDGTVVGTLAVWHLLGATSPDDGYNLAIARVTRDAGYVPSYYRYFGTTEAPFDWYHQLLATMTTVSANGMWMRLPATLAGIACWLLISRVMLHRLGSGRGGLCDSTAAVWTAGAVFTAAWLAYNNGLRPEPLIALGVVAVWVLVERAIAGRLLTPVGCALLVAGLALTLAPQGVVALAPLLTGARAVVAGIRRRSTDDGLLAPVAVLAAAASAISLVIFRSQTLATVAESARIKYTVGPTTAWYHDLLRYYYLTLETVDGSLTRRFAWLVLMLAIFGVLVVLLRRGRIPGLAAGPVWRLIGTAVLGLMLLTLTPTKWAVQLGVFAGVTGALAGVMAFAFARAGLHSRRNLWLYFTALLFLLAVTMSGYNSWFYTGGYGVPWYDLHPVVFGRPMANVLLLMAVGTGLMAAWAHFRMDYTAHIELERSRANRLLCSTPLLVIAALIVILEVGSMLKGAVSRYPAYTNAKANVAELRSLVSHRKACALGDDVLVEPDANAGLLQPIPGQQFGKYGPLGGANPVGFSPNAVMEDLATDLVGVKPGQPNTDADPSLPTALGTDLAGTAGGKVGDDEPDGVNGSRVALPFGLDRAKVPVLGSYKQDQTAASAASVWYALPEGTQRSAERPLVVLAAAGAIWSHEEDGTLSYGQQLRIQYGATGPDGQITALGSSLEPLDIGPQRGWRNLRWPLAEAPGNADAVRVVANDPNLSWDQWFVFTPPRVPKLQSLQQVIGDKDPVLLDVAVAASFPCQRPFTEHLGIAELPGYRIMPDRKQTATSSNPWQAGEDGGPFLFTTALLWTSTVPTYLRDDWKKDWGAIERYHRLIPDGEAPLADIEEGTVTVTGWSRPGPIRALP